MSHVNAPWYIRAPYSSEEGSEEDMTGAGLNSSFFENDWQYCGCGNRKRRPISDCEVCNGWGYVVWVWANHYLMIGQV